MSVNRQPPVLRHCCFGIRQCILLSFLRPFSWFSSSHWLVFLHLIWKKPFGDEWQGFSYGSNVLVSRPSVSRYRRKQHRPQWVAGRRHFLVRPNLNCSGVGRWKIKMLFYSLDVFPVTDPEPTRVQLAGTVFRLNYVTSLKPTHKKTAQECTV